MTIVLDRTITCRDCGQNFVFTSGEQEFFAQKGFTNSPVRCPGCRATRKAARGDTGGFAVQRERQMFPAVCAQCGKDTRVPFQPSVDRPVYCSECFSTQRTAPASYDRRPEGGYGQRPGHRRLPQEGDYFARRSNERGRERW